VADVKEGIDGAENPLKDGAEKPLKEGIDGAEKPLKEGSEGVENPANEEEAAPATLAIAPDGDFVPNIC